MAMMSRVKTTPILHPCRSYKAKNRPKKPPRNLLKTLYKNLCHCLQSSPLRTQGHQNRLFPFPWTWLYNQGQGPGNEYDLLSEITHQLHQFPTQVGELG